ncbi:hypothetical protein AYJ54_00510 [Bradyrhizobium centrolobii]|uniref:Uncharacterized protein n=1 Tax=Bradyrhizobium centrolobii TaxID=1505087 RepID=A0A176YFM8_9BRAD|nr:hypothetical protein [Bradyrhizobium centrolobii]OAF05421.1 hypothetical protein AYJ54_00510 [Bradyrhizobium centrolobii]
MPASETSKKLKTLAAVARDNASCSGEADEQRAWNAHAIELEAIANRACDFQSLLEIRDFLQDIVGGAEITERSRDTARGFVYVMDAEYGTAWRDGASVIPTVNSENGR